MPAEEIQPGMGWGAGGAFSGDLRADLKKGREQGPRQGHSRVQRPWCSRQVWPEQRREAGGQGQRSHGASGLARVKPLVPGSGERPILLDRRHELV